MEIYKISLLELSKSLTFKLSGLQHNKFLNYLKTLEDAKLISDAICRCRNDLTVKVEHLKQSYSWQVKNMFLSLFVSHLDSACVRSTYFWSDAFGLKTSECLVLGK